MGGCISVEIEQPAARPAQSAKPPGASGSAPGSGSSSVAQSKALSSSTSEASLSAQAASLTRDGSKGPLESFGNKSSIADSSRSNHPQARSFTFREIQKLAKNFHPSAIIGEGGFGPVYRGQLPDGQLVAVKALNCDGGQGHREWEAEVKFLGQLNHPHLVRLVGYCSEGEQRNLVYEFMPNGSLDTWLFESKRSALPWDVRMKIALHAARGMAFLHGCPGGSVIFRDLKPSNVLLDSDFNAKLSDFGLAKSGPEGNKSHVSTRVMGTQGYAAPEYVYTGHLTIKSDVYTYGVVLVEIITGRAALDTSRPRPEQNLVQWARPFLSDKNKYQTLIDPRLQGQYSPRALKRAVTLAVSCLQKDANTRPTMADVARWLEPVQGLYQQEKAGGA